MATSNLARTKTAWLRFFRSSRLEPFRFYAHFLRWPVVLALGAAAGGLFVVNAGLPLESWYLQRCAYLQALRNFASGHDEAALFEVRKALIETRDDPRLWRLAARISERLASPEAPYCWEQADRLAPGSEETQLGLARSALQADDLELAAVALREVAPEKQNSTEFITLSGRLAMIQGNAPRAGYFFEQVKSAGPRNPETCFALAEWHMSRGETTQAQAEMEALATVSAQRLPALRKLVELELEVGRRGAARTAERRLLSTPGALFSDRLAELDAAEPADVDPTLKTLLATAPRADAPALLRWMAAHGRAETGVIWIRRQEESWQDDPEIGAGRAACLAALNEWAHLRDDQRDSRWPGRESLRLTLMAEASAQLGDVRGATAAWQEGVAAAEQPDEFLAMGKAADGLPDSEEARAGVWLAMADRFPAQQWPLRRLLRHEITRGNLALAQTLADRLAALAPGDAAVAATRDLLELRRGFSPRQAESDLARLEVAAPDDPTVSTASAYALYLEGHFDDALAMLGPFTAEVLQAPDRAPYFGEMLAAAGPVDRAETVLTVARMQPGQARPELDRAFDLLAYRRAITALLDGDPVARQAARGFFLARAPGGEPVFVIGASVSLLPDRAAAAGLLARIEPESLDRPELELYGGAVQAVAGPLAAGAPHLRLANDLPVEDPATIWENALATWWEIENHGPFDLPVAAGLLAAARGLDLAGAPPGFWAREAAREVQLTAEALQAGVLAGPVQERLEALTRHVPATPEIEAQVAYALFLRGRVAAARQRIEVLTEPELHRPGPARYYAAILRACGETKRAAAYAVLAGREVPPHAL